MQSIAKIPKILMWTAFVGKIHSDILSGLQLNPSFLIKLQVSFFFNQL